jgi:hypothetical protein
MSNIEKASEITTSMYGIQAAIRRGRRRSVTIDPNNEFIALQEN